MNEQGGGRPGQDAPSPTGSDDNLSAQDIKKAALSGARWLPTAQMVNQGLRIATSLILALLLSAEDFGLVAVATVVVGLIDRLSNLGTGQAIIQRKTLPESLVSAISTLNACIGLCLGGIVILAAEPITALVGGSDSTAASSLMRVLGVNVIVSSFGVVPFALLRRRLQFRSAATTVMSGGLAYAATSIGLAIVGFGPWSLVIGTTAGSVVNVVMSSSLARWRPQLSFDVAAIRGVASFSLGLTGTNMFNYATQNVDRSLIARALGPSELGIYVLGVRVLRSPLVLVTSTINQVMVPVLSRLQNDLAGQRRHFLTVSASTMLLVAPAMLGLAVLADPLVNVVLPPRWMAVADLIEVMAPIGLIRALWGLVSPLFVANAKTGRQFVWSMTMGTMLIVSYFITAPFGILAVVVGIGLVHLGASPIFFGISFRIIDLRFVDYVRAIAPAGIMALAMASLVYGTRLISEHQGWSDLTQVVLGVATGAVSYLGLVLAFKPRGVDQLQSLVNRRLEPKRKTGPAPSGPSNS